MSCAFVIASILSAGMTYVLVDAVYWKLVREKVKYQKRQMVMAGVTALGFLCYLSLVLYLGPFISKLIG